MWYTNDVACCRHHHYQQQQVRVCVNQLELIIWLQCIEYTARLSVAYSKLYSFNSLECNVIAQQKEYLAVNVFSVFSFFRRRYVCSVVHGVDDPISSSSRRRSSFLLRVFRIPVFTESTRSVTVSWTRSLSPRHGFLHHPYSLHSFQSLHRFVIHLCFSRRQQKLSEAICFTDECLFYFLVTALNVTRWPILPPGKKYTGA